MLASLLLCLVHAWITDGCNLTVEIPGGGVHCYSIVDASLTRDQADQYCRQTYTGSVVTVTSSSENHIIQTLMQEHGLFDVWLGIQETFTSWQWFNGNETFEQGCFEDKPTSSDFIERNTLENNTFGACEEKCRKEGYRYGGLQGGVFCWCGNSFGKHGHSESGCNRLCPGDASQVCGGESANNVLAVGGTYSQWSNGQPNNHFGYQTCAIADPTTQYDWLDVSCTDRQAILCHIKNAERCSELSMNNTMNSTYEHMWYINNASCFYFSVEYSTWFIARDKCQQLDGDFVIVDSKNITSLLDKYITPLNLTLTSAGFWIGLYRSHWNWQTYEQMSYTNWEEGRPNGFDQLCAVMYEDGTWDDVHCDGQFRVICETDSSVNYETSTTTVKTTVPTFSSTPSTTTTKRPKKKPHRTKPRIHESERGISDEHMASIVAGAIVMLIIIVVVVAVYCIIDRRQRKKRKEEEEDAKREKYFFGLDGDIGENTLERPTGTRMKQNAHELTSSIQLEDTTDLSAENNNHTAPSVNNKIDDVALVYHEVDDVALGNDQHSVMSPGDSKEQRLSGKPDVIPD